MSVFRRDADIRLVRVCRPKTAQSKPVKSDDITTYLSSQNRNLTPRRLLRTEISLSAPVVSDQGTHPRIESIGAFKFAPNSGPQLGTRRSSKDYYID